MLSSKYVKRFLKAILFVAIFIVLTLILDAVLEYDESGTAHMLSEYSKQDNIETIFVGTSSGIIMDAEEYTELTGEKAYNMCSAAQSFNVSLDNIKLAASQHPIKKVVMFFLYDSVNDENTAIQDHIYDRVVMSTEKPTEHIRDYIGNNVEKSFNPDIIATEESINLWIPWTNEASTDKELIKGNIKRRFDNLIHGYSPRKEMKRDLSEVIYETNPGIPTENDKAILANDLNNAHVLDIPDGMLNDEKLDSIDKICIFCRENNIKLIVIATPHRTDYFERYDSFRHYSELLDGYIDDFVSKRGLIYYNSEEEQNLHELFPDSKFMDLEHIDFDYTDEATEFLTGIIRKF